MKVQSSPLMRNIPYAIPAHERQVADWWFPTEPNAHAPSILLIHGGGWNAMSKEAMQPVAQVFLDRGFCVLNVNYRLLQHAPWPACRDDVLTAGNWLLSSASPHRIASTGMIVVGASAGGHLAMTAGLALPPGAVCGIVSMAGPWTVHDRGQSNRKTSSVPDASASTSVWREQFFGNPHPTDRDLVQAGVEYALNILTTPPPPLWCIHSHNDRLVPLWHSQAAVKAWHARSARAELLTIDGKDNLHGFWSSPDVNARELVPDMIRLLNSVIDQLD